VRVKIWIPGIRFDSSTNNAIARAMAAGAYGGTPGRNALRPYGISAGHRNTRMFFLPRIFASIRDRLHRLGFSTLPQAGAQSHRTGKLMRVAEGSRIVTPGSERYLFD